MAVKSTVGIVLKGLVVCEVTPGSPAHTTRAVVLPASPRGIERDGERECLHKNSDADRIQPGDIILTIDGSEVKETVSLRECCSPAVAFANVALLLSLLPLLPLRRSSIFLYVDPLSSCTALSSCTPSSSSTPTFSPHKPSDTSSLRRHARVAEGLMH